MEFGLPKTQRERKEDKYSTIGVITLQALEKEGSSRKMHFNSKALELLNIDLTQPHKLDFSFNNPDVYVAVMPNDVESGLSLGKTTSSVSNKNYYNYIRANFNQLDETTDLELVMVDSGRIYNNNIVYKLTTMDQALTPCDTVVFSDNEDINGDDNDNNTTSYTDEELYALYQQGEEAQIVSEQSEQSHQFDNFN